MEPQLSEMTLARDRSCGSCELISGSAFYPTHVTNPRASRLDNSSAATTANVAKGGCDVEAITAPELFLESSNGSPRASFFCLSSAILALTRLVMGW
jgi:hypothetical protein